jgi:hypothetical protein
VLARAPIHVRRWWRGFGRGFVSVRLLVLLGLVVAAVWVVPLTLLQSKATHPTTSAGPTAGGHTGTGEPAGAPAVVRGTTPAQCQGGWV